VGAPCKIRYLGNKDIGNPSKADLKLAITEYKITTQATTNPPTELARSSIQYSKPYTSAQLIKGEKVEYQLWFDGSKWNRVLVGSTLYKAFQEEAKIAGHPFKYLLLHKTGAEAVAVIYESRIPSSLESVYKLDAKAIRIGKGHIINKDIRMVNGNDVLYIKYSLPVDSINWIYLDYYLSNETGVAAITISTPEHLFEEHESDMIDLLNGFVDSNPIIKPAISDDDIESKLLQLKDLRDKGLITQEDYDKKKDKLLDSY